MDEPFVWHINDIACCLLSTWMVFVRTIFIVSLILFFLSVVQYGMAVASETIHKYTVCQDKLESFAKCLT